jgi:hypothetical protein
MLKTINPRNIILTPIKTTKKWTLNNNANSDLILLDGYTETSIVWEYTGNYTDDGNIALEQIQFDGNIDFQVGTSGSGHFDESTEPQNSDGTYTRLVYSQIYNTFYNSSHNPAKTFGLENIDFGLSKTNRHIHDNFLLINVPRKIFGETILPNSVMINNFSTDDAVVVYDDGFGNMLAGNNIFYRIQEVRHFENIIPYVPLPINLEAASGDGQVGLIWTVASGATSYHVKRSTTVGGSYTTVGTTTSVSFTDTTVTNGTTYYYVVSALNAGDESANSNQATATPSAPPMAYYYNNATGDGNFNNINNWWIDSAWTIPANILPIAGHPIYIDGTISTPANP